jgi:G2/mitotic-specific cyclin 1/2
MEAARRRITGTVAKSQIATRGAKLAGAENVSAKNATNVVKTTAAGITKSRRDAFADVTNSKNANVRTLRNASKTATNAATAFIGALKPDTASQNPTAARRVKAASKVTQPAAKATKAKAPAKQTKTEEAQRVYAPPKPAQRDQNYIHPLDLQDMGNHLMAGEYALDIFSYMRDMEHKLLPTSDYMKEQAQIEWKFRRVLIDWMLYIHERFNLHPETLFLAVNIVDRFLTQRQVSQEKLQIVGIAALLIASKYEEQYTPPVSQFVYMAKGAFSDKEVLRFERTILYVLEFELGFPAPTHFLRRISKAEQYCIETRTIAKFFLEVGLLDERFIRFPPSMMAAASMWIARRIMSKGPWNADLEYFSGYKEKDLILCVQALVAYLEETLPFKNASYATVFKKYSHEKFLKAAQYVENWMVQELQKLKKRQA